MSLTTLVAPYTAPFTINEEGGRGVLMHEDGAFTLSSPGEWFYSSDDVPAAAMVRVSPNEQVPFVRDGADVSIYLRTRAASIAALAVSFKVLDPNTGGDTGGGGGSLTGHLVWVDAVNGNDATGVAGDASKPFFSINAAITAAAETSGHVIVRPGTYHNTPNGGLRDGVDIHCMAGVVVTCNDGAAVWDDLTVPCAVNITGHGVFNAPAGGGIAFFLEAASTVRVECDSVSVQAGGYFTFLPTSGKLTIKCRAITGDGTLCKLNGGAPSVFIEATESITAGQILVDTGSTGATRVSIKAPDIKQNTASGNGINIGGAGAARYDIDADILVAAANINAASGETHIRARTITNPSNDARTLDVVSGKVFIRCDECYGGAGGGLGMPVNARGGTTHLMSGRYRGADAEATGHAVAVGDGAELALYPGVTLIAGNDAGTFGVGLAAGAVSPHFRVHGTVAANKNRDASTNIDCGSLLVNAAVA